MAIGPAIAAMGGLILTAPPSQADEASVEAVTVTATRTPQPVSETPATVAVIDAERIADEMVSDVRDLVRFEPGVSVRRSPARFGAALGTTGRAGAEGFNIRGIEGNRVLIQVDGVRLPDGFGFGAQAAGRGDYVDLGLVKSVEILRGPASALYGSDGLAGAVSFITSDPIDLILPGEVTGGLARAAYDSADREFSETLIAAHRWPNWAALVAYTRRDGEELDNQGSNAAPNATRTRPNPQETFSDALLGKLVWDLDEANKVRLTVDLLDSRVRTAVFSGVTPPPTAPATLPATAVLGLTARDATRRDRVSLDWRYEGSGLVDTAQAAVWYQNSESIQFSAEDRNTASDRTRLNTFENRVVGLSFEARRSLSTGPLAHTLILGADHSLTRQSGLRNGTVPTPPDVFPTRAFPKTDLTLSGVYLADNIVTANGRLSLYPAVRYDWYEIDPSRDPLLPTFFVASNQSGSRVSPKLGAVFKADERLSAFVSYARGFKSPSPLEINQFFDNPSAFPFAYRTLRNPSLGPETSETIEAGVRLADTGVRAELIAFSGRYRDFIAQLQTGGLGTAASPLLFQYVNLARVEIEGVEGRVTVRPGAGLTLDLAFSHARGDQIDGPGVGRPLLSVDPLKVVAGVRWRDAADRFGGQLIATHSARKESDRTSGGCSSACFRPDAFTLLDATAFVRMGRRATARLGVFNILDETYAWWSDVRGLAVTSLITDAFTQPGRNASLSLSLRF